MPLSEVIGYVAVFLMGVTLGVIGAGGSILTLPILVYLFGVDVTLATAYSLVLVGATAATAASRHVVRGELDYEALLTFGLPSVLGVYLSRRYLLPAVPEVVGSLGPLELTRDLLVMLIFAGFMLAAAFLMIRGRPAGGDDRRERRLTVGRVGLAALEGLVVGAITGFVGAGGGFLIVPALVWLLGLSIRKAVTTSLAVIAVKSLLGFLGDLQVSRSVDWLFLLGLLALSALGILVGMRAGRRLDPHHLQLGFGWFVLATALFVLARELLA